MFFVLKDSNFSMHRFSLISYCVLVFCAILASTANAQLSLIEFPTDRQLYGRVGDERIVDLPISGTVTSNTGITSLTAKLLVGTQVIDSDTRVLSFNGGQASFLLTLDLPVTRTNHSVELSNSSTNAVLATANFVVAGDVYVVNGQSNAEAGFFIDNSDRDPFLRGYNPLSDFDDPGWSAIEDAACGQWMGRAANALSNEFDLPIGVFNFAEGGRRLTFFEPGDASRNFETSFELLREAGVRDKVKGFLWSQGEADGFVSSIKEYRASLTALFDTYLDSLALVDEVYLWQVRAFACSGQTPNVMEAQRRMNDALPYVTMLSTVNVEGLPDSCHFPYTNGREILGNWMADLLRVKNYGATKTGFLSPTIDSARITGPQKITLFFDLKGANQLAVTGSPWVDFQLEGPDVRAIGGTITGNTVDLFFNQSVNGAEGVSYYSHVGTANDYLHTNLGLGVITFFNESLTRGDRATGSVQDADLRMQSTATSIAVNDEVEVVIDLLNRGTLSLREVDVVIPLLGALQYGPGQSIEVTTGDFDRSTNIWAVPIVRPGEQATLTITYRVLNAARPITVWGQVICSEMPDEDSTPLNGIAGRIHEDDEARVVLGDLSQNCSFSANLVSSACNADSLAYWTLAFSNEGLRSGSQIDYSFNPMEALNFQSVTNQQISLSFDTLSARNGLPLRITLAQDNDPTCASSFTLQAPSECRETMPTSNRELPELTQLGFSPNPVKSGGVVVISSQNTQPERQAFLYDATGRLILQTTLGPLHKELNLPILPEGVYLLRVGLEVGKVLIY